MNVVFFGTPDFAVPALRALQKAPDIDVKLVVSQPDRRRSRNKMEATPVKLVAEELGIPVITPEKVNRFKVYDEIAACDPDFLVVIAYGQIIGKTLLETYPDRIVNIHGSVLPKYRGAAPIQRAMLEGQNKTGITSMLIERQMDAGDMLAVRETEICEDDDVISLTNRLSALGADLILETIRNFDSLYRDRIKQDEEQATYAAKIERADGRIDLRSTYRTIFDQVRGLKPWPSAYLEWADQVVKVHKVHKVRDLGESDRGKASIGDVRVLRDAVHVVCRDAVLSLDEIQFPNQKRMPMQAYLLGNTVPSERIG